MKRLLQRRYRFTIKLWLLPAMLASSHGYAQSNKTEKIHLGIIYPISTNGTHATADTNIFSFHALAGASACEKGLSFAGVSNVIRFDASGLQFAGFSNHVGKSTKGILFAGFINTYREGSGLQFAGFSNIAAADIKGAQFAGFLNKAGDVNGSQFAGFSNSSKHLTGSQFAGFANSSSDVKGSQFGGFINTAGDIKGSQIAGFMNIARKVKGVQIAGFINIADSSATPIGLINIIRNGEKSISISADETLTWLLSFRSGGKILYGIVGGGYHPDQNLYAFEAGFGAHFSHSGPFRINIELSQLVLEDFHPGEYFKTSLRLLPALKPVRSLELFAGPALNFVSTNTIAGREIHDHYIRSWETRRGSTFQGIYIGYTAGISILF